MTEILPIGVTHLHDIPTLLRNLADEIENGAHGDLVAGAATFLCANSEVFVCGWGRTDDVHSSLEAHADTFILINQALDDAFQNCDEPDLEAVATLAMMLGDRLRHLEEGPRRLAVVVETLNHMIEYAMQGDPRFDDFFRQWRAKPVHHRA